jgi:hypothetical protein
LGEIKKIKIKIALVSTKVVKTGPDRPVEPGTGPVSGPVDAQNRNSKRTGKNRVNRCKTEENW